MLELVILAGLAVFALVMLLQTTAGPADIFQRLRLALKVDLEVWDGSELLGYRQDEYPTTFIAKLYGCPWCLSTWAALGVTVLYILTGLIALTMAPVIWLAVLGLSMLLRSVHQR